MDEYKEKTAFASKLENIWYYYKWHIFIGICALIMLGVGLGQFFSKVQPDAFVYYVGQSGPTAKDISEICETLEQVMPKDFNGDGKKKVDYKEDIFVMYTPEVDNPDLGSFVYNSTEQLNIVQRFNFELGMGECLIYVMEPNLFKANAQYIAPLEDILGYTPENSVMGRGIRVSDLKAYRKTSGFKGFPEDCIIGVRIMREGIDEDYYKANALTFKALVEAK